MICENMDIKSNMRERGVYFKRDVVPLAAMIAVECTTVGSTKLFKAATLRGLSFYVYVFYAYLGSTLLLLTISLIFGRSRRLPSAKSPLFFKIFLLALLGLTSRVAGCKGIEYSSPTLSSAISNLTPAFTSTLAVFFRMEQLVLRSSATSSVFTSFSLTQIMEIYPEEITVVFLYNLCATLISAPVCLFAEKDLTSWKLKPGIELAAVIYSGLFDTSLGSVIHTWGLHLKGPVYVSMFKPLSIAISVAMAAIFLHDSLHLGSVIGSIILSFGFYTVIWGKAREDATKTASVSEYSLLLPSQNREDETLS